MLSITLLLQRKTLMCPSNNTRKICIWICAWNNYVSYTLVCVHVIVCSMYVSSCSTPTFSSPSFSSPVNSSPANSAIPLNHVTLHDLLTKFCIFSSVAYSLFTAVHPCAKFDVSTYNVCEILGVSKFQKWARWATWRTFDLIMQFYSLILTTIYMCAKF